MTIDRKTAKLLCDAGEFELVEMSQKRKLESLTEVELNAAVERSRTLRDKWQDVSRAQRRSAQSAQGARQTAANARSDEKAALFSEIHQLFADRQRAVQANQAVIPAGTRPLKIAKPDRKIVHRTVRSAVKGELKKTKNTVNRSARAAESSTSKTSSPAAESTAKPVAKPVATSVPAKPKVSRVAKATKKTATSKVSSLSKTRSKRLAKRAERPVAQSVPSATAKSKAKAAKPTKTLTTDRNPSLSAKATQARVASGGSKRLQAHVSSVGKRSQARRDSKNG